MAQYTYITLNDGTKWRIKGDVQPQVGSGPYRYVTTSDTTSTNKTGGTPAKNYNNSQTAKAQAAAVKAQEEKEKAEKERRRKLQAINSSKETELKYLGDIYDSEKKEAKLASEDNMRQLYIAYMQGLRGVPQQSALWGAGGEIESLKNRLRINYEDNRAKEDRRYAGALGEIQRKYDNDLRDLEAKYLQRLLNV